MRIANKTIVITGASKGLGKGLALRLCRHTPKLVLVARTESLLRQLQDDIARLSGARPLTICCDVTSERAVADLASVVAERFDSLDVLINNAGVAHYLPSLRLAADLMRRQFEVNVFAAFYVTGALMPLLLRSESAYVLNIGSDFARVSLTENSIYAASKRALAAYTEGLRRELCASSVAVGIFNPGPMPTSLHADDGGGLPVPSRIMLEVDTVARKVEQMIRGQKASASYPWWMVWALRLRALIGRQQEVNHGQAQSEL